MMARGLWQVLLLALVAAVAVAADMKHDVRNWEVVDSAAVLVVGFDIVGFVEEVSDIAAAHGVVWVVVGEDKIHSVVECLFVEEEDSTDDWFVLEEVMMEGEQSVAVAVVALSRCEWCYQIVL
jgi:hypothetical protein